MSADESAPTSWQAGAPPLTLTASSSPTDHRNINSLQRNEFDDSDDDGKNNSRDASQSRISDHIEIPKDGRSSDNHEGEGEDDEDGKNNSKKRDQNSARNRRNAPPRLLQGPGLKWHKEYSALDPQAGRVLMIDFARSDKSRPHIRKVAAQEIFTIQGLRRFYKSAQQAQQQDTCAMRVIHVQNADWAIPFLMRKFNISSKSRHSDDGRSDFGRYLRYKNPELRGGKPFLAGRTWKVQYDPWRGVNRTSFGLDYMKSFRVRGSDSERRGGRDRMMQLNDFDQDDEPIRGHDVYVQRLSCYIQHKQAPSENRLSRDDLPLRKHFYPPDVYGDEDDDDGDGEDMPNGKDNSKQQRLRRLDNGNVIIIFDNSSSGNIDDTLIPARRDLECRWRRLPFHLAFESHDPVEDDDARLALHCSKAIVSDIFKSVVVAWDAFLDHAVTHMTILEDKIYERPDDESRAPELWANSSAWLKVEKLVNVHASVVQEMKMRLHELTDDVDTEDNWLDDSPSDFERLTNLITEDLTKPTESLISLLYQSVSIRDSRHSLELGVSMWRLSWITFIFLPLTFIVGFFGMNVDTFSNMPSIKWYFIAAIPFMFGVLTFYFLMKGGSSDSRRRSPRERIVYETFFQEMASRNPTLWSRNGPRDYVRVEGWFTRLKWWLIRYWLRPVDLVGSSVVVATTTTTTATPTRTTTRTTPMINNGNETIFDGVRSTLIGAGDGLSTLSRLQRYLSRRWTAQIANRARTTADTDTEMGLISMNDEKFEELARASGDERFTAGGGDRHHSIGEGLTEVAEIVAAPAVPRAGRPWSSAPSSLDGHDHDHDHGHDSGGGGQTQNTHLTVPGIAGKALWTTTTTTTTTTHDDHDRDRDDDTDEINTSEITNPVIVAALARERARQGRLRSNSSPSPSPSPSGRGRGRGYVQGRGHRRGGSGGSSGGSGSSPGGRNSDRVLVEEEDAAWLNERGRKGKDWIWRFGGGSVSDDDKDKEKK